MKTLYLDCSMGVGGDMLVAALLELLPEQDDFVREMNELGIPNVHITKEKSMKCGISGTCISVMANGMEEKQEALCEQGHRDNDDTENQPYRCSAMKDIEQIIEHLMLSPKVKSDVLGVYSLIADAESHVYRASVTDIRLHEAGIIDAIATITAVCLLVDKLAPQQIIASPIHVGSGYVSSAFGSTPVPTPDTAYILRNVPFYGGDIKGVLCTPVGAALIKYFATSFGDIPVIKVDTIGYGMKKRDFEAANCLRAMLGETSDKQDKAFELNCNVDDMTAEEIGFAMDRLFEAGALEVFTVPVGMKKTRPGTLIRVLCRKQDKETIVNTIFKYTTTIGIREIECNRYVLERTVRTLQTPYGEIRRKDSIGYGVCRSKYEYDDLSRIAKEKGASIAEVKLMIEGIS